MDDTKKQQIEKAYEELKNIWQSEYDSKIKESATDSGESSWPEIKNDKIIKEDISFKFSDYNGGARWEPIEPAIVQWPQKPSSSLFIFDPYGHNHLGIVVPVSDEADKLFTLILDENNKLWYVKKDDFKHVNLKPFEIVFFRFDNNNTITYITSFDNKIEDTQAHKRILLDHNHFFGNITESDEVFHDIPVKEIIRYVYDYEVIQYKWISGTPGQYDVSIFCYLHTSKDATVRIFLKDLQRMSYKEITGGMREIIINNFRWDDESMLFDGNRIQSIYNTVNNFNPYKVFESYRVEITYHHTSRPGKDDYFREYKTYSIDYLDEYLSIGLNKKVNSLPRNQAIRCFFNPKTHMNGFTKKKIKRKGRPMLNTVKKIIWIV